MHEVEVWGGGRPQNGRRGSFVGHVEEGGLPLHAGDGGKHGGGGIKGASMFDRAGHA